MREIKFRFWDKDREIITDRMSPSMTLTEWLVDATKNAAAFEKFPQEIEKFYGKHITMQFTGLKDRNGTEIYEDDILTFERFGGRYKVTFERGCFRPNLASTHVCEVVGNIHENPEMLNDGKRSKCCNTRMVNGGIQCETCGSNGE